ncbi:hypothetical protein GCM10023192_49440 [Amycolatopsis samaneae]
MPGGTLAVITPSGSRRTREFDMADEQRAQEQARKASGVVPVQFSASAEAHDDALVTAQHDASWRSPFGAEPRRAASGG